MMDEQYGQLSCYTRGISEPPGPIFLSGTQALVRMVLAQAESDRCSGLNTAGFVSGYRGSPLGSVDLEMWRVTDMLREADVVFKPAINEDLAATAVLGSQKVETDPTRTKAGVFSLWYGKGPGVDRSGDALRHGNAYGSSPHGGVLVVVGDDHGSVSSSMSHQSDGVLIAWGLPVIHPASVEDYVSFGLWGWALSRFSGLWVSFKAITETVESSRTLTADATGIPSCSSGSNYIYPLVDLGPDGLHWRWPDLPGKQIEKRLKYKIRAALSFAAANPIDRLITGNAAPKMLIVAVGKAYLDVMEALQIGGLSIAELDRYDVGILKVGLVWPLSPVLAQVAERVKEVLVVEEKAPVVETLLKDYFYNFSPDQRPTIVGKADEDRKFLLPNDTELRPELVAKALASRLSAHGVTLSYNSISLESSLLALANVPARKPFFCPGCPHNRSTQIPSGSRAQLGIGCHALAAAMPERNTSGSVQMGGEGIDWIGQSPFVHEKHIFQNVGDGTFFHSGILAIRQAVAAGLNITYKILYNHAVAMTGGQPLDGSLTVPQITQLLTAEGVRRIVIVTQNPKKYPFGTGLPDLVSIEHRDRLETVQRELREIAGVTALIYDQVCSAEEQRRRKRKAPGAPIHRRLIINELVCEGCGDCQEKSNCLSLVPVDTEFGRKRMIDQQSCNGDYSCLLGFCPSFVTVDGASRTSNLDVKAVKRVMRQVDSLPAPPSLLADKPFELVIAGIGGMGAVTLSRVIALAAHLESKSATVLNFSGFAQKGGPVLSHVRIAKTPLMLHQTRIVPGEADAMIATDLVVACSKGALRRIRPGKTRIVSNTKENQIGQMLREPDSFVDVERLLGILQNRAGDAEVSAIDAQKLSEKLVGALYTNMFMLGFAWQRGLVPVKLEAIERAIKLHSPKDKQNYCAFSCGRVAATDIELIDVALKKRSRHMLPTLEQRTAERVAFLEEYQDRNYSERYLSRVTATRAACDRIGDDRLVEVVAVNLFKLMARKDEYEVARLHSRKEFVDSIKHEFGADVKIGFYMRPNFRRGEQSDEKTYCTKRFGSWILFFLRILSSLRSLRGTFLDPFRYSVDNRAGQRFLVEYEAMLDALLSKLSENTIEVALKLFSLPQSIKGYGLRRRASIESASAEQATLVEKFFSESGRSMDELERHSESCDSVAKKACT